MNDPERRAAVLGLACVLVRVIQKRLSKLPAWKRRRIALRRRKETGVEAAALARQRARLSVVLDEARSKPCADCGQFYGTERMEFDHVPSRGPKRKAPCECRSKAELRRELVLCDVVCCLCHSKRETARGRDHGGGARPCPNRLAPGGCDADLSLRNS